ncbi:bifunctional folylpolyglutamate synthase/dihydrofolate synthase [Aurantibacter aestuarii]|uniref:Dihydrofolate synthase/folylpolyglutamate synthase n=1 Tax=Aurantibacter aestuarii TaxID=1266046 RepID=A0A2T1N6X4_9FLAO|nr:folylpolyglutamate synthase/dihydrofolate synthase family protein [Aurantibacter aestuarii]PSG87352.1 tetrahydrofolate synthase [Aurantibacter aestuarii]
MFQQLPMYQKQGSSAYKKDLSNTLALVNHLNHPEHLFKSIHVAGTNGKGSCSHMLASILQEAGYKVGLYTSPHLKDFRERIKINGNEISEDYIVDFISQNRTFFETHQLSFFEMTVGLAFSYFAENKVDVAIIEVGLGGRLDSTNVIKPEACLITNIGLDHTQFLGETLAEIAAEKTGIIKANTPVIISETHTETEHIFLEKARQLNAEIVFADQKQLINYQTDLLGNYQLKNKQAVYYTIKSLSNKFKVSEKDFKNGFLNVVKNTNLLGRWQILHNQPKVICDTAHNAEGLSLTMQQLSNEVFKTLRIVFGVVSDKDLNSIAHILPKEAVYYFCQPDIPRAMDARDLFNKMTHFGFKGYCKSSVNEAYQMALKDASLKDVIYIGGSTFVVAEVV